MSFESKVQHYLAGVDCDPLKFSMHENIKPPKKKTVENMVTFVLLNCRDRMSYTLENDFHCRMAARRSALDIWRHIKFYTNRITLYSVMRYLYRKETPLPNSEWIICTSYCVTINKRVFFLMKGPFRYCELSVDEMDLILQNWERIGLK